MSEARLKSRATPYFHFWTEETDTPKSEELQYVLLMAVLTISLFLPRLLQHPLGDKQCSAANSIIKFQETVTRDANSFPSFTNYHNRASKPGTGEESLGCERHMFFGGVSVEGVDHTSIHPDSQRTATEQQTAHTVSFRLQKYIGV